MNRKGFTLVELVLVIAILGILAVSALPKFIDLSGDAEEAATLGVVGAVRSGIALYRANAMVTSGGSGSYPVSLDSNADAACATCFDTVLAQGIDDEDWSKAGNVYTAPNAATYTYNATNGTFQ